MHRENNFIITRRFGAVRLSTSHLAKRSIILLLPAISTAGALH